MKKNQNGFVLAETLIVTVFLMLIFTLIYSHFYPLIGDYERREEYDNVDGKYTVFWLKRMIESPSYLLYVNSGVDNRKDFFLENGYLRFSCMSFLESSSHREYCKLLVKELSINGCDENGENCDAFITPYKIGNTVSADFGTGSSPCFEEAGNVCFKDRVKSNLRCSAEDYEGSNCGDNPIEKSFLVVFKIM